MAITRCEALNVQKLCQVHLHVIYVDVTNIEIWMQNPIVGNWRSSKVPPPPLLILESVVITLSKWHLHSHTQYIAESDFMNIALLNYTANVNILFCSFHKLFGFVVYEYQIQHRTESNSHRTELPLTFKVNTAISLIANRPWPATWHVTGGSHQHTTITMSNPVIQHGHMRLDGDVSGKSNTC